MCVRQERGTFGILWFGISLVWAETCLWRDLVLASPCQSHGVTLPEVVRQGVCVPQTPSGHTTQGQSAPSDQRAASVLLTRDQGLEDTLAR